MVGIEVHQAISAGSRTECLRELEIFVERFPDGADLAKTNPALALCISKSTSWDTLRKGNTKGLVEDLLHTKRRDTCKLLGFPGTESVVRILSKVAPEACNIALLMRMRRRINDASLVKILSHITRIGEAEMQLIAYWEPSPHASVPLFLELAAEPKGDFLRLLRLLADTERMMEQSEQIFPHLRSVAEVELCHLRLIRIQNRREVPELTFPAPPVPGTATIQPLVNPMELLEEGRAQRNCVTTYARDVASGGWLYFYRVLEPERATVSIRHNETWELDQIAGPGNSEVSNATRSEVEKWLSRTQPLDDATCVSDHWIQ
jgi:hypothetical protein